MNPLKPEFTPFGANKLCPEPDQPFFFFEFFYATPWLVALFRVFQAFLGQASRFARRGRPAVSCLERASNEGNLTGHANFREHRGRPVGP